MGKAQLSLFMHKRTKKQKKNKIVELGSVHTFNTYLITFNNILIYLLYQDMY